MKPDHKILQYPRTIYNENEILNIYKKYFPLIINEYQSIVRKTYCNPREYKKIVQKKAKIFDTVLDKTIKQFQSCPKNLENLVRIGVLHHKNYAFNFWLISYAMGEGPLVMHYLKLVEKILKNLYSDNNAEYEKTRQAFLKTDFQIFYHKILITSLDLIDLLKKIPSINKKLQTAKNLSYKERIPVYNQIVRQINRSKNTHPKISKIFSRHKNNKTPIYNLLNQGIDYYQENILLANQLKQTKRIINHTLRLAEKKLSLKESKKLKNLYFLIREMIIAKDFTFGRRDIKLFKFWHQLTAKIYRLAKKELNFYLNDENRSFLLLPWKLEKFLPKKLFKAE
jgi:hypothetical protein